jgi:hypothetical protein
LPTVSQIWVTSSAPRYSDKARFVLNLERHMDEDELVVGEANSDCFEKNGFQRYVV